LPKEIRRQEAIVETVTSDWANVRPRPNKAISFGRHNPGAVVVKAKSSLGGSRNLDCCVIARWFYVGDRHHGYHLCPGLDLNGENNDAWAVFPAFLKSSFMFGVP